MQRVGSGRPGASPRAGESRVIESRQNERFKDLKLLLGSKGIRRDHQALVAGSKIVMETLSRYPDRCIALVTSADREVAFAAPPRHLGEYRLSPDLFRVLDVTGTRFPMLLVEAPPLRRWEPAEGLPPGANVLIPFQDPENVGAVIRSAVAFGADRMIMLAESAHPYLPKTIRASSGAVLAAEFLQGPALADLPGDLPVLPLSSEGKPLAPDMFPATFGLLPGVEGRGLPETWRARSVAIPVRGPVESLNAATATAIALYVWSTGTAPTEA